MTRYRVVLASAAELDIAAALQWSEQNLGIAQARRYEARIIDTLIRLGDGTALPVGRPVPDRPGLFRLPLRRPASHALFYARSDHHRILVLRLLHDAMDIAQHLPPDPPASPDPA